MHVFIRAGLKHLETKRPYIFEFGFGTGLNTLLTLQEEDHYDKIDYCSIELYPVEWEKIARLAYPSFLMLGPLQALAFEKMHKAPWDEPVQITPKFTLTKIKASILEYQFNKNYDLVYYDAFAPDIQPLLWKEYVFQKLFNAMYPGSILVTYCAKGEVRRAMQRSGFIVERLPGPPGKREILRACK
jgi:tRNA U34 5-methylaminomethyl-2-thiouridine-forming methyltransferase MnmC